MINLNISHQEEEWPMFFKLFLFISKHYFLELTIMSDFSSYIIEIIWLTNLISVWSSYRQSFKLNIKYKYTLRFITAPDYTSPNLKCPVVNMASALKNLHVLFLYSGNLFSSGIP